ncbi:MAG: hypothetical protein R3E66_06620 [bacterium]
MRFFVLAALLLSTGCGTPRPKGTRDARADELAQRMMASVNADAWQRTGAITWTFRGSNHHLWDRQRQLARVRTGDLEVFVDLKTQKGVAFEDGVRLEGDERDEAVKDAYAAWANDSFWLVAMNKAFDPGTTRSRVPSEDGREALMVEYSSGGVTPGDVYLWHFDENGRPVSWQMWVSIIPIDGLSATWEDWVALPTGAYVSTAHDVGIFSIDITDLDAAESLAQLVDGPDPFAVLTGSP